jgi:23S rRNA pseudouridine1911/1915/1917 synthase
MANIQTATIPFDMHGKRIDQVLVELFPDYSRSRLQSWLKTGDITIDDKILKAKNKALGGELIKMMAVLEPEGEWLAEDIPLDIKFEDEHIIVVNKPAKLVVHPAVGNYSGTLLNALIYHCPSLVNIPRAGIVHRLDKDTTGLLVIAKTIEAQTHLVKQLQLRAFEREYEALVVGELSGGTTIETLYGRHPTHRTKMSVLRSTNNDKKLKTAITHYRISERYAIHTRLKVNLETGRTHQIRVHLAYKKIPIVGDKVYGGRLKYPIGSSQELISALDNFNRQALHARKLGLEHPVTHQWMSWEQKVPDDHQNLYRLLLEHKNQM